MEPIKIPSFSDIENGTVAVESAGTAFRTVYTKYAEIRIPEAPIQIITHPHTDQMPAILQAAFVPGPVAYKTKVIYRQYGLRPKIVAWRKFQQTFHYSKGRPVFSSAMEFPDFAVIGESAEQWSLVERYSETYSHGVVVRTPPRDTKEKPIVVPSGWFYANNNLLCPKIQDTLPKICPTLRDIDINERIREAVLECAYNR